MRGHEIGHVNIVPDAGTVRRRIVGAEHVDLRAPSERRLDRDLDEMGRPPGGLTGPAQRVGAGATLK
jgi:hypothetical protein